MQQYRAFTKKFPTEAPTAYYRIKKFTLKCDLLVSSVSRFETLEKIQETEEGDFLTLYDSKGKIIYTGIVKRIDEKLIETSQFVSLFSDNWLVRKPTLASMELNIKDIIDNDFKANDDLLMQKKFNFKTETTTATSGEFPQEKEDKKNEVKQFEKLLYELFEQFNIILQGSIPFSGSPIIFIGQNTDTELLVSDNNHIITELKATSEVVQTNKLIIYNKEGTQKRATFYVTKDSIKENPTIDERFNQIKTKFIFSDDEIEKLKNSNLEEETYNHKITFNLMLGKKLYNFADFTLGRKLRIWKNKESYTTILTAYEVAYGDGNNYAKLVCGKVRTGLGDKIKKRLGGNL